MNTDQSGPSSNASTSSLKRKSDDIGWDYGELIDLKDLNPVKCTFCQKIFKGGIYRIKCHLAHYGTNVKKCQKVFDEAKKRCWEAVARIRIAKDQKAQEVVEIREAVVKSLKIQQGMEIDVDDVDTSIPPPPKQPKKLGTLDKFTLKNMDVSKIFEKDLKQQRLNDSIAKECLNDVHPYVARWVYQASIPFNAIAHPSFIAMMEAVGIHGRGYLPPSIYQLSMPLLKKEVERTKESLKNHEEEWKETGCSLMTDAWTDRKHRSIMNLCVNSRLGTIFLSSKEESEEAQTAEYIANYVNKGIDQVGEENGVQIVTDNAANNMAATKLVLEKRPKLFWSCCAAHTIDLILEGIGKIPKFHNVITKAKNLTVFIYAHNRTLALMRKYTLKADIVRPGVTRFATAFLTLQSLYEKKEKLRLMFTLEDGKSPSITNLVKEFKPVQQ